MRLPLFTAEASLYKSTWHYRVASSSATPFNYADHIAVAERLSLPVYGNHCGPGFGDPAVQPVDPVDCVCYNHDRCYEARKYNDCSCDYYLISAMPSAIANTASFPGKMAGLAIEAFFEKFPCKCHDNGTVVGVGIGGEGIGRGLNSGPGCCFGVDFKDLRGPTIKPNCLWDGDCLCPGYTLCESGSGIALPGETEGVCINPQDDPNHCGECDVVCPSDQPSCCYGTCTDLQTDSSNCGICGTLCPSDQPDCCGVCTDKQKDSGNCGDCGVVCPPNQPYCCDGVCSDIQTDSSNCGACDVACSKSEPNCCGGVCTDCLQDPFNCRVCGRSCPSEQPNCCNGVCTDVTDDPSNCGGCGNTCLNSQTCTEGTCNCTPPLELCSDGCADLSTDINNCGECDNPCSENLTCCEGTCSDTSSDPNNCGFCGNQCQLGSSCCGGTCSDTSSDPNNCGFCGNECQGGEDCFEGGGCTPYPAACIAGDCVCPPNMAACGSDWCMPSGAICCGGPSPDNYFSIYACIPPAYCCGTGTGCCSGSEEGD
jgi:stigma-specific protein Stig1